MSYIDSLSNQNPNSRVMIKGDNENLQDGDLRCSVISGKIVFEKYVVSEWLLTGSSDYLYKTGILGGQTAYGGTASGDTLDLNGSSHANGGNTTLNGAIVNPDGEIYPISGLKLPYRATSTSGALVDTDYTLFASAIGGNRTLTLPIANGITGKILCIKRPDTNANTLYVDGYSSNTIDGESGFYLLGGASVTLQQNSNTSWSKIGESGNISVVRTKKVYTGFNTIDNVYLHIGDSATDFQLTITDGEIDGKEIRVVNRGAGTITLSGNISSITATSVLYQGETIVLNWDATDGEWQ